MTRILFVCLGNICRSPMAEAVFRHKVGSLGLTDQIEVDSAGTGDWHVGEQADSRTLTLLSAHQIDLPSRARQLLSSDFDNFDHLIGMDDQNVRDLQQWRGAKSEKVSLFLDWTDHLKGMPVPDPYYGSHQDFERVYELVSLGSDALIRSIRANW